MRLLWTGVFGTQTVVVVVLNRPPSSSESVPMSWHLCFMGWGDLGQWDLGWSKL